MTATATLSKDLNVERVQLRLNKMRAAEEIDTFTWGDKRKSVGELAATRKEKLAQAAKAPAMKIDDSVKNGGKKSVATNNKGEQPLDNTTRPASKAESEETKKQAVAGKPAAKDVPPVAPQGPRPKNNAFYIPAEALPISLAAAGRDPREILKAVHAYAKDGHHIVEATSGLILLRASWQDDENSQIEVDMAIPRASWDDIEAASGAERALSNPNGKGRALAQITGPDNNHKIDFLPLKGTYPQIESLLPHPWGTGKKRGYNETRLDPRRMMRE